LWRCDTGRASWKSNQAASLKLITWNINRRRATEEQAEALKSRSPDLVALQEVRLGSLEVWREALADLGLRYVESTRELANDRRSFLLTASRWPLCERGSRAIEVPMAELILSTYLKAPARPIQVINTHVPNGSSYGWRKVEHLEALYRYLVRSGPAARILCGDFNSPQAERDDGTVLTWGQSELGNLRPSRGQRWDAAERGVILGLEPFGLRDVFRCLNGYSARDGSWAPPSGPERRFDHVFAAPEFESKSAHYLHEWRGGLSDHSALEVVLEAT